MKTKVDQAPATNSNPVLSVDKNGCVFYSNEAGNLLLNEWDVKIGEKLPSSIANTVQKVITHNNPEKMEVNVGIRVYLIVFHLLPEQEYVNISGFDISDQKKAEEETKESEERIIALMDHNPSLLFMKDECGRYVYLNNAYEKQFVHSKDWYGKTDFDFWPKESAELFRKNDSLVLKSGQMHQFMEDSIDLSGTRYCWLNYKFPFTDSKNKRYVGGIGIDATDRVRAEEALQESEEHYRMLFTNMTEGFGLAEVIYNNEGKPIDYRYLEINPAFGRYLGVKREQLLGKTMRETFPNVSPIAIEKYGEVVLSCQPINFEIFSRVANKYLDIYAFSPEKGKIAIILRDFTEHKKLEEQTRLRAQELETIMEVVPVPILISHDLQGYNITGNRMANEFYGAEVGENISARVPKGVRFFYKGRELCADELPVQQAAKKDINLRNVELEVLLPSGKRRIITVSASPLHNNEGHVRSSVGAFIDITELKETEAKLNNTLENLDKLVKERTAELQKAYDSLKKSERSLAEAQEIAHIGSWERNIASNEYSWSDELYLIFGLKPQESKVNYDTFLSYVHPDDRNYVNNAVKEAFKGKTYDNYFRIIRANGEERIAHAKAEVVFDEKNNPVRIRGTTQDITERKRIEEALRQSEERFNLAVKAAQEGVWDWNIETNEVWYSPRYKEMLGYSEDEIEHHVSAWLRLLHPDDKELSLQLVDAVMRGERNYELEFRLRHKDGHYLNILSRGFPVRRESDGKIVRIVGIHLDLTERKQTEEEIRNLANIVESSNDAICTMSLDNIITNWNKASEEVYGYSEEEIIGKHGSILAPPHLEKEISELSEMIKQGKKVRHYETSRLRKDGKIIDVSMTFSPVFDSHGNLLAISVIARDITERKRVEEKLRNSEEKYRNIVETANELILTTDNENVITYVNPKIIDMLGYTPKEVIGRPIWSFISEECKLIVKANLEKRRQGVNGRYELKLIRKDGSYLWTFLNAKPLFDKEGKYVGAMSMLTDITKRKEAEETLAKFEIARQKEIHHRIKNNLQVISSLLELQAEKFNNRECVPDSEVLEAFRESHDRVLSMALIHEELYKSEGFEALNFSPYIKELADTLFHTYRLGNTDISLIMDLEENIFFDMDTAVPLGIIVNELISNSLKHAFPDRKKGDIQIKLRRDEEHKKEDSKITSFILTISDNGVGIPENLNIEDLDSLGMQLVISLVDQLDGELELKRDNGTEFTIRFTVTER